MLKTDETNDLPGSTARANPEGSTPVVTLDAVLEKYRALRNEELRLHGGRVDWQGRCGAQMNALMDTLEAALCGLPCLPESR